MKFAFMNLYTSVCQAKKYHSITHRHMFASSTFGHDPLKYLEKCHTFIHPRSCIPNSFLHMNNLNSQKTKFLNIIEQNKVEINCSFC